MYRKLMIVFIMFMALSLTTATVGSASAQGPLPPSPLQFNCPPFDPNFGKQEVFLQSLSPQCLKDYQELTQGVGDPENIQNAFPSITGGPDAFGYTYNDAVAYSWVSASTVNALSGDDNTSGPINIGFNFPFYGVTQTQLYLSTNGLITFGEGYRWYGGISIPNTSAPNNYIAPFWEDLVVGAPDNAGAIYTTQGGIAPNRYIVIEWRNITRWSGSSAFSFEAILYENGDILFQHQSLPASYNSTVGIENGLGDEGLKYQSGSSGLTAPKAIRFYYPTTPTARISVSPLFTGSFSTFGGTSVYPIKVSNIGNLGTDTYDLTISSTWPVTLYSADGVTSLTDTDLDTYIDTGPIPQGSTITIIAKITTLGGAVVGDDNVALITTKSSIDTSKSKVINLQNAIPSSFARVYEDDVDGAMSIELVKPDAQFIKKATPDSYYGDSLNVAEAPNGNYVYLWTRYRSTMSAGIGEIEYAILDHSGNVIRAAGKLTDYSGATTSTYDYSPSLAVAPNGTIGVTWRHYIGDSSNHNDNIYFATLDISGNLTSGPSPITNNAASGNWDTFNIPFYYYPAIASTDDNFFVLSWEDYRNIGPSTYSSNIWYAIQNSSGSIVLTPTALTSDNQSYTPVLNTLSGGKVIVIWMNPGGGPYYAVINRSGAWVKAPTGIGFLGSYWQPDAVYMPNGKTAIAWPVSTGVAFAILDSSYNLESGPTSANSPTSYYGYYLSIASDASSRVIMNWLDAKTEQSMIYALGDSTGAFITAPMFSRVSTSPLNLSYNGQGIVGSPTFADVPFYYWAWQYPERLFNNGVTGGCSTGLYCPENTVTRAQMAVFLLKSLHGSGYVPPALGGSTGFGDVAIDYWAAAWIKQLAAEGITSGCGAGNYCPDGTVTRAQMSIFLLKAKHGSSYSPPSPVGVFTDVPLGYWADKWIEQLASEGVTSGCGGGNYCPDTSVTRAQMAVFLVKAFNIP